MKIPTGPEALSTAWLTEALRTSKTINQASVTACQVQALNGEGGITGQPVRFYLSYDRYEADAPHSLIAKFSASDPEIRKRWQRSYEREVRFYQKMAPHVELRTPHCYYSDIDTETGEHVLLLEDLAPARSPAWEEGCSLAQTEQAIQQIAKFHATWWESPQLADQAWVSSPGQKSMRQRQEQYQTRAWGLFIEKVCAHVPAEIRAIGEQLGQQLVNIMTYLQQPPVTLTHGDYKPDNFFFATAQGGVPFAVVDWQVYVNRRGGFDVAYFLCGGIRSEIRQRKEMDWLRSYHGILLEHGVRDYAFEQCLFDYRLSLLLRLIRLIGVMGNSSFSQEQENLLQRILLPRCCSAILDFDARTVLADLDRLMVKEGRLRYE